MADFLEALMLLCFGLSWPVSLIKNIRSGTAKGMSLMFTVLIIIGYIAGISAKIYTGNINYVLLVYIWNIVLVVGNLIVYFVNKNKDRHHEHDAAVKHAVVAKA